jgi:hypothetical protein
VIVRHALVAKVALWLQRQPRTTQVRHAAAIWQLTGAEMNLLAQWCPR